MTTTWIYHERQQALLCGQHALNNLLQIQSFSPDSLAEIAHQLDQMELNFMSAGNKNGIASKDYLQRLAEGSGNVDASGNFSIEVLRSALLTRFNLTLANTMQETVRNVEITNFDGFICNKQSHWFAIRKVNGLYWNLNSTKERPEQISHFRLAAEIESLRNEGYSVFCVVEIGALPEECKNEKELAQRGSKEFWWSESDLHKGTGVRGHANPWGDVGSGMRLDGQSTASASGGNANRGANSSGDNANGVIDIDGLTEDEMIQLAMSASLQPFSEKNQSSASASLLDIDLSTVIVAPEPVQGAEGAIRIQFRLPDGKRLTRRFLKSESVKVLAAFVQKQCPRDGNGTMLEMRAGFPPKDISPLYGDTIEVAKLAGDSIQCRYT